MRRVCVENGLRYPYVDSEWETPIHSRWIVSSTLFLRERNDCGMPEIHYGTYDTAWKDEGWRKRISGRRDLDSLTVMKEFNKYIKLEHGTLLL